MFLSGNEGIYLSSLAPSDFKLGHITVLVRPKFKLCTTMDKPN